MARGNQGQAIYADDLDRKVWLETLGEACARTGWQVQMYGLMRHPHAAIFSSDWASCSLSQVRTRYSGHCSGLT